MRDLETLNDDRVACEGDFFGDKIKKFGGAFDIIQHGYNCSVQIMSFSDWEHLSIDVRFGRNYSQVRIATTEEMKKIKEKFFEDDEVVMEVHPKKEDYVNISPYILHLWRPVDTCLPIPPMPTDLKACDTISLEDTKDTLLVLSEQLDGWTCYEISIMRNGRKIFRYPSWNEMCIAKKALCGEDVFAIQYHLSNDTTPKCATRIWLPPKDIDFPLPEPYMVGARNDEEFVLRMKKEMKELQKIFHGSRM